MNSINDLWSTVLDMISSKYTSTSIATWFSDCKPVAIKESTFIIYTPTDFKRKIITNRFGAALEEVLTDLFSSPFTVQILCGDETLETSSSFDDVLPEMEGYTFDNFIVGNSNKFAHAAAVAVTDKPGQTYNPLFIYGNSGLGKTHLLLAIGHDLLNKNPNLNVAYIKGDDFTNELIQAISRSTTNDFHEKYRNVELLLVDDIQFIAGKTATQEEFFHTFNTIYESGHQIVITSDRPPMEMTTLDDRLRTRFEGGLMADIQPPDLETRMAIIRNKATQLGLLLSDDVVLYIAENITSNIRQIEGVIKRLTAYKEILDDTITIDSIKRAISDVIRVGTFIPSPDSIINATANYFNMTAADLTGVNRTKGVTEARQISMYLIRTLTNLSLPDIGKIFNRNHSTVLVSIRKIESQMEKNPDLAAVIRDITSNINSVL
ncbi:MAG: chromosomal replication initiator protein DnaA [Lachnospiraceae bacterium]|nr:chromosomal replication initiator protein DnaA [Oscillospiraceae bacterium]MBQ5806034.1 chromosomal replication initiator protein DnaA [Lachnospiraceae bacterium]